MQDRAENAVRNRTTPAALAGWRRACACASFLAAALAAAGCDGAGTSFLSAAQRRPAPKVQPRGYLPPDAAKTITLEFDASDDIRQRSPDGGFVVSAFQVGFFSGSQLVRALEIPRSEAQVDAAHVRLKVPLIPLTPGSPSNVTVRVRPLSSGPLGPWSASAGSVTLPVEARQERSRPNRSDRADSGKRRENAGRADRPDRADPPARGRAGARPSGRQVTAEQLERFPMLKEALGPALRGASQDEALAACASIENLATAVVLSRKHGVPVPLLCSALRGRADDALAETLKRSDPSIDVTRELRAARAEARALVRDRPRERQ